jgi:hypothetical protein
LLLNRRNDVAHGTAKAGLEEREYARLDQAVSLVVDGIVNAVSDAVVRKVYLLAATTSTASGSAAVQTASAPGLSGAA